MALNIKSDEADRLARELARRRGQSITAVVTDLLRTELEREKRRQRSEGTAERLMAIGGRYAALPVLDDRSDEDILGYDEMTGRS
ncbi:MAG: protein transcription factor [Rhodospirillaceae bacterium]|nr:protein transcription factor [Rhodospirillaceae bacterium]|tara:strand:+ start:651 stop:905 length:255 start_codon:yes stop_codon:yes gene_type:complete